MLIKENSEYTRILQFLYIMTLVILVISIIRIIMVPVSTGARMSCGELGNQDRAVQAVKATIASSGGGLQTVHDFLVSSGFYNRDMVVKDGTYQLVYLADMALRRPCLFTRVAMLDAPHLVLEVGPDFVVSNVR